MLPAFLLLHIGQRRCLPLPLPLILLWPLLLPAVLIIALARLVIPSHAKPAAVVGMAWLAIQALCQLRGLTVDVRSHDGECVYLRFI